MDAKRKAFEEVMMNAVRRQIGMSRACMEILLPLSTHDEDTMQVTDLRTAIDARFSVRVRKHEYKAGHEVTIRNDTELPKIRHAEQANPALVVDKRWYEP